MEIRSLDDILTGLKGRRIRIILREGLEAIENPTSGFVMVDRVVGRQQASVVEGILYDFYKWTQTKAEYVGRTLKGYTFMIQQDKIEALVI